MTPLSTILGAKMLLSQRISASKQCHTFPTCLTERTLSELLLSDSLPFPRLQQQSHWTSSSLASEEIPLTVDLKVPPAPAKRFELSLTQLQACCWFMHRLLDKVEATQAAKLLGKTDKAIDEERNLSRGGPVANPPGLGKTLTAIAFHLIYRVIGTKQLPALFIDKEIRGQAVCLQVQALCGRGAG